MDYAFKEGGFLAPRDLPAAEREGLAQMYRGAVLHIRNPVGHRNTNVSAPEAFSAIGVIDYLLRTLAKIARARFVTPFVADAQVSSVLGIRKVDLDGDGVPELVVVLSQLTDTDTILARILILNNNGTHALGGTSVVLPFPHLISVVASSDFDDDGRVEPLVILAKPEGTHAAVLLDLGASVDISPITVQGRNFLTSEGRPPEVVQGMEWGGALTVACRQADGTLRYWTVEEGVFIEAVTDY